MAVDNKDIELVATELKNHFDEFKSVNNKRIEAIAAEKNALSEKVDSVNTKLSELDNLKSSLEAELASLKRPEGGSKNKLQSEHKEAFSAFIRKGRDDGLTELERKAMQTTTEQDGGYAVPEELNRDILSSLKDETVMRSECNVIMVGSPEWKKLVNKGGTTSGWVGEIDERPETSAPQLGTISPIFGELYGNPYATQTMLDDSFFNVEKFLHDELIAEFAEQEEEAFTLGDGLKKPKGFLSYDTNDKKDKEREWGILQSISSGKAELSTDDLVTITSKLRKGYRKNARFMVNSDTLLKIRLLKDDKGNYIWQPGLQLGQASVLLGYGVAENEFMPDIGDSSGKAPIAFGNFKRGFYIFDRIGIRMLRDPYTRKPFVGFYTTKRVGSMLNDSNAIKLLTIGGTATKKA